MLNSVNINKGCVPSRRDGHSGSRFKVQTPYDGSVVCPSCGYGARNRMLHEVRSIKKAKACDLEHTLCLRWTRRVGGGLGLHVSAQLRIKWWNINHRLLKDS